VKSNPISFDLPDRDSRRNRANRQLRATAFARRIPPAIGLFLTAPLIAEFLLGNMSITHLGLLAILAPLYGGGALVIRESVRMAGRGWPSIFLMALAYGILEEAFLMQSLFNPDFLGQNLHLLETAFLPGFGIGAWYTLFVLTLHTVWSIPVPIALMEALDPEHAESPWIGKVGFGFVAAVFALGCVAIASFTIREDPRHFVASRMQFTWSAVIILALIALSFSLPRRASAQKQGRRAPNPWLSGIGVVALASAFLLVPRAWEWWAVVSYLSIDALAMLSIWIWSGRSGWGASHRLSIAGGAAMAYAWHAFIQTPSLGSTGTITRMGNLLFAVLAANLVAAGARKASYPQGCAPAGPQKP
jgi:hypothetical protein